MRSTVLADRLLCNKHGKVFERDGREGASLLSETRFQPFESFPSHWKFDAVIGKMWLPDLFSNIDLHSSLFPVHSDSRQWQRCRGNDVCLHENSLSKGRQTLWKVAINCGRETRAPLPRPALHDPLYAISNLSSLSLGNGWSEAIELASSHDFIHKFFMLRLGSLG